MSHSLISSLPPLSVPCCVLEWPSWATVGPSTTRPTPHYCKMNFFLNIVRWMGFERLKLVLQLHSKLRNVNLHNIIHSLISPNPRERMVAVHISLLIVTFLSLVSQIVSLMQTTKEVNPHPRIASCANMWSVTFFFFFSFSSYGTC